jgi:hypothetical protein
MLENGSHRRETTRMARSGKPTQTVQELLEHPYVKRALEDPEVRDNAKAAYESAQAAYERLRKVGSPAAIFDDRKLQKELKTTGKSIASTREHLMDKPRKRRRGRFLVLTLIGAALAIALSEGLRNKVLDALFGAEEEFDYVSTTAPPAPAAAATPTAAAPAATQPEPVATPAAGEDKTAAKKASAKSSAKNSDSSAEPAATSGD